MLTGTFFSALLAPWMEQDAAFIIALPAQGQGDT